MHRQLSGHYGSTKPDALGWLRSAIWLAVILLVSSYANGDCSPFHDIAVGYNQSGVLTPIPFASVRVCGLGAGSSSCSPPASVFSDSACSKPLSPTFLADPYGNYSGWAAANYYDVYVSGPSGSGIGSTVYSMLVGQNPIHPGTTFTGDLTPAVDNTYSLGAAGLRWKNGFIGTNFNNIRMTGGFASSQAAVNDCSNNPCLVINPSQLGFTTDPTDTGVNHVMLDLNDSRFFNIGVDHSAARLFGIIAAANTLTQSAAPYDFLSFETHTAAGTNSGGVLHTASLKLMPFADAADAQGNDIYGLYVNMNINQSNGTSADQHAAIESVVGINAGSSQTWAGDFHIGKLAGVPDSRMTGFEIGMHKVPALGAAANWGLLIHSDDAAPWVPATRAGSAIRIGGTAGWTSILDAVDVGGGQLVLIDQTGKQTNTSTGTAFVCNNQSAGQGCRVQFNDNAVQQFAAGLDTSNNFTVLDQLQSKTRLALLTGANADDQLNPTGSGQTKLSYASGTGGVCFGSGASTCPASSDSTGKGTFAGGVAIGGTDTITFVKFLTDTPGAITVNAGTCTDRAVAFATISATATIMLSAAYALDANIIVAPGQAVAATAAHYRLCNPTGANITLNAAASFNLKVIQ